ncbi:MAG: hypothetical protein EHM28_01645 [Spirochaetaceae bacterium]|nr:MAG: hypothetical protein EHM28_01645 [Spirochaetaceae bacterium]
MHNHRFFLALSLACALVLSGILFSCGDNGISLSDLKGEIQRGSSRLAQEIFAADSGIVALASNGKYVYAATRKGDVWRIKYPEKPILFASLGTCSSELSFQNLAVLPDGRLCAVKCRQDAAGGTATNSIVAIDENGTIQELFNVNENILCLAADHTGKIYAGTWINEGKISYGINPYHLASAEFVMGKLYEYNLVGKQLTEIYTGALPAWIWVGDNNTTYVSLWGDRGPVQPDREEHLWADHYHSFWLPYSERIKIIDLANQDTVFRKLPSSFASFIIGSSGFLLGLAATKEDGPGFYLVEGENKPIKLKFQDSNLEKNISAMTLHQNVVYFGTPLGKVLRIK